MTNTKATAPSYLKDLFLLFAIPIAIAVLAAAIIYTPRLLANPKYDFIYAICDSYDCRDDYSVDSSGKVVKNENNSRYYNRYAQVRYFSVDSDATRSLTLEQAQQYKLSTTSKSPDGYSLNRESSDSGFLFWGNYDEGWYLKDGAKKKRIELSNKGSYYSGDIKFLGWVEK